MLLSLGIVWLACAAIFLELADRAPIIEDEMMSDEPV